MNRTEALQEYRLRHHLTQKEVAAKINISREYYAKIEEGKKLPSYSLLRVIAHQLALSIVIILSSSCTGSQLTSDLD